MTTRFTVRSRFAKIIAICGVCFAGFIQRSTAQEGISVNTTGNAPDPSAILDIQSDVKGVLIPRLTTNQRTSMNNPAPATGLIVYDSDYNSFWYYNGSMWTMLGATALLLQDQDQDTRIQVEESADEDIIRFDVAGSEVMRHDGKTLNLIAPGNSLFIGEGAGTNDDGPDDGVDNKNTFIGYHAGFENTTGSNNLFIGQQAGASNTVKSDNLMIGNLAGAESTTTIGSNMFIGNNAGWNSDGFLNVHIGAWSGENNVGNYNTFIGVYSGNANQGSGNHFVGYLTGTVNEGDNNYFSGFRAGHLNTTGSSNYFSGYFAGNDNTTGSRNHFVGYNAGRNNAGSENHYTGYKAGEHQETGEKNHFSGYFAGNGNTTGSRNLFIGYNAGKNDTDSENHFTGYRAGENHQTGQKNHFSGYEAGLASTNGLQNTFVGYQSGHANIDGDYNTAFGCYSGGNGAHTQGTTSIGYLAGWEFEDASGTFIGREAGQNIANGDGVTIVGAEAGKTFTGDAYANTFIGGAAGRNAEGTYNTYMGYNSGHWNEGIHNVFLGYNAGNTIQSGNFNTFIGSEAGSSSPVDSVIAIGHGAYSLLNNSAVIGVETKYFGMGIKPNVNTIMRFAATTACLTVGGVWQNASDVNLKENFKELSRDTILEKVARLPITQWNYIAEEDSVRHIGPMAQDFYAQFGLGGDNTTISTIDPAGVALVAIQALYQKQKELELLKQKVDVLSTTLAEMSTKLDDLTAELQNK